MKKNDKKLIWELSAVIGCKLAIIAAICFVFFGPDTKTEQTPEAVPPHECYFSESLFIKLPG